MDSLRDLGCWVADHFGAVSNFVFALTVAGAAVFTARLTRTLVRETIQLRQAETDPYVAVYIEASRVDPFFLDMVIRNVARGSAYDVSFSLEPDHPIWIDDDYRLSNLTVFAEGISYMAPAQEIRFEFGSYPELVKEPIKVVVIFHGARNGARRAPFRESFTIDVRQFKGMVAPAEPTELRVAKALETLATDLHAIRWGGSEANLTADVRRRYILIGPINRRWNRLSRRWQNFRIRWANGEHPWRKRWDRLRWQKGSRP